TNRQPISSTGASANALPSPRVGEGRGVRAASLLNALGDTAFGLAHRPDDAVLTTREVRAQHMVAIAADRLFAEVNSRRDIGQRRDRTRRVLTETPVAA